MKSFVVYVTFILFWTIPAQSYQPIEGQVSVSIGPDMTQNTISKAGAFGNLVSQPGIGLKVLGDFGESSSLEVGMSFGSKIFVRTENEKFLVEKIKTSHIGMGYRKWWNGKFSTSLVFGSSYGMGEIETLYTDFVAADGIDTSAKDPVDYSADFSLNFEVFSTSQFAVLSEFSYLKLLTPKPNEKSDQYQFQLGILYLLQEKSSPDNIKPRSPATKN